MPATATIEPNATAVLPTNTPLPAPSYELRNGDFEQGDTEWIMKEGVFIADDTKYAHSGSHYAQFGGENFSDEKMLQRIKIPTNAPFLTFWSKTLSGWQTCDIDIGYIWVNAKLDDATYPGEIVKSIHDFCESDEHEYRQERIDLTKYAGQVVELRFEMKVSGGNFGYWHIDDIAFQSAP